MTSKKKSDYARTALNKLKKFADEGDLDIMGYLCKKDIDKDKYLEMINYIAENRENEYDDLVQRHACKVLFELTANTDIDVAKKSFRSSYERTSAIK